MKTVGNARVLYVMAADPEYGPHLRARFSPLICGVGPVEAAVNVTQALAAAEMLPALEAAAVTAINKQIGSEHG